MNLARVSDQIIFLIRILVASVSSEPGIRNSVPVISLESRIRIQEIMSCKRIYSVFFFIKLKVFVNLTYLYLSEIKKQGLIFSVGMGHLIICRKNLDLDRGFLSKPVFSTLCMQSVCRVMNGQMVSKLLILTLFFSLLH